MTTRNPKGRQAPVKPPASLGERAAYAASRPPNPRSSLDARDRPRFARDQAGKRIVTRGPIELAPRDERRFKFLMGEGKRVWAHIPNQRNRERSASYGTQQGHRDHLRRFLRWMLARSYRPPSIRNLKLAYVEEYFHALADPVHGYSVSYQRNVFTSLTLFYEVGLGKVNCIKAFHHYFGDDAQKHTATVVDKAASGQVDASGNGLVPEEIIARLREHPTKHARRVAAVLGLCLSLGMRLSEALCVRPILELRRLNDEGYAHIRAQGSKGGRAREVIFFQRTENPLLESARRALEEAATFCSAEKDTIFPIRNMERSLSRVREMVNRTLSAAGITKAALGVTSHSFRHEFVWRCWQAAGHVRPLDGPLPEADRTPAGLAALRVWRMLMIERIGHSDPVKTDAYLGSATQQLDESEITRAQRSEAQLMHSDINRGDLYALSWRLLELQALPYDVVRAQVLRNLDAHRWSQLDLPPGFELPLALAYAER